MRELQGLCELVLLLLLLLLLQLLMIILIISIIIKTEIHVNSFLELKCYNYLINCILNTTTANNNNNKDCEIGIIQFQ